MINKEEFERINKELQDLRKIAEELGYIDCKEWSEKNLHTVIENLNNLKIDWKYVVSKKRLLVNFPIASVTSKTSASEIITEEKDILADLCNRIDSSRKIIEKMNNQKSFEINNGELKEVSISDALADLNNQIDSLRKTVEELKEENKNAWELFKKIGPMMYTVMKHDANTDALTMLKLTWKRWIEFEQTNVSPGRNN